MVLVRGTQKLLMRLKRHGVDAMAESTTALGDWYGNVFFTRRARLVFLVSDRSLLSVFVPARDWPNFSSHFRSSVSDVLQGLGIPEIALAAELREMEEVKFGRTASRTVLGSMIDLAYQARWELEEQPDITLPELAIKLSRVPCGPIGMAYPREVAAALLTGSSKSQVPQ